MTKASKPQLVLLESTDMTTLRADHPHSDLLKRGSLSRKTNLQEQFQIGLFRSIAAAAGCCIAQPELDEGIDFFLTHRLPNGRSTLINVQMKCTANKNSKNGQSIPVKLSRQRYDQMRITGKEYPFILVVHQIPEKMDEWIEMPQGEISILRHKSYWANLTGEPDPTSNSEKVTVHVPTINILDDASLLDIIVQCHLGDFPK